MKRRWVRLGKGTRYELRSQGDTTWLASLEEGEFTAEWSVFINGKLLGKTKDLVTAKQLAVQAL